MPSYPWVWSTANSTSTGTSDTSADVWNAWNSNTWTASTANTITFYQERELTEEERAAQDARREAERQRLAERRAAAEAERAADPLALRRSKQERERDAARTKALTILCEHLTREQIAELVDRESFRVQSPRGVLYRIDFGYARNVREIGEDGRVKASYCAHPSNAHEIPDCDTMLVQKLMLESHEDEFLRIANRHPASAEAMRAAA